MKSEKLLTSMVHIFYAIPPNWPRGSNWERILPTIMAILIWLAFCMEMSIIKLLWTQGDQGHAANKHPPIGSVLLVILLELSSTVSFTIMVIYFFKSSNRFHYSSTKLIPGFEFAPLGKHQDVTLKKVHWLSVNLFLVFAITGLGTSLYNAMKVNIFFSFTDLHEFTKQISDVQRGLYYSTLVILNWAHMSSILACGTFYIACCSISSHIDFTEKLLVSHVTDFNSVKEIHECLLKYSEKVIKSLTPWFTIHSSLLGLVILLKLLDIMSTIQSSQKGHDISKIWLSEVTASWFVAIQFAFPFLSASLVTRRYEQMYEQLNRRATNVTNCHELDAFLNYCLRCKSGFYVLGIRITTSHAVMSIASVFIGLFRFYKELF